jgi:hypothetical protein
MKTIKCNNCGTQNDTSNDFCFNCGTSLKDTSDPTLLRPHQPNPESRSLTRRPSLLIGITAIIIVGTLLGGSIYGFTILSGKTHTQATSTAQAQTQKTVNTNVTHAATAQPNSSAPQKVAVPSYFDPGNLWTQMESGAPTVGLAIINPNSGPGTSLDQQYANQVTQTENKGITVVGYVSTSYAGTQDTTRTLEAVEQDINHYYSWYPNIGGIFVDEVSTDCKSLSSYYQPLYNYIKTKQKAAKVVLDPGSDTSDCYMSAGDIIVNFDDTYSNYIDWTPASWVFNYPASRFWQIIYSTNQTNMPQVLASSKNRNAGWIYATDNGGDNPFDALPSYWKDELSQVK